jgi:predicted ATPase
VHFGDLAGRETAEQVATTLLSTLQVPEVGGDPPAERLAAYLQGKRLLLVADNLAAATPGAALLGTVGAQAPGVAILGLSPAGLQMYGSGPARLRDNAAITLFVDRARAAQPHWAANETHLLAAAAITARLDGLPLAIELAAARSRQFTPGALLRRMDARLHLLVGDARDRPARHQTLRALIDWSYDLLDGPARDVLARLAVFAGGCTVEAAGAICAGATVPPAAVAAQLAGLAEQSLLRPGVGPDDEPRYVLLETIREYAAEQLAARQDETAVRARHAAYFLALAERAEPELHGAGQVTWLRYLDVELNNLLAALAWLWERQEIAAGLRLAGALQRFWFIRGLISEGRLWLARFLAPAPPEDRPSPERAKALLAAAFLRQLSGDVDVTASVEEALTIYQTLGDSRGVAAALLEVGTCQLFAGDPTAAAATLGQSLALYQELGDTWGTALALARRAGLAGRMGDYATAHALSEASSKHFRQAGDLREVANQLRVRASWAHLQGDNAAARRFAEQGLALHRQIGDKWGVYYSVNLLGDIERWDGNAARAIIFSQEELQLVREMGVWAVNALANRGWAELALGRVADGIRSFSAAVQEALDIAHPEQALGPLAGLAAGAGAAGTLERAVLLFGAFSALSTALGREMEPVDQRDYEHYLGAVRSRVTAEIWATAWAAGQALTLEQAITYALADDWRPLRSGAPTIDGGG